MPPSRAIIVSLGYITWSDEDIEDQWETEGRYLNKYEDYVLAVSMALHGQDVKPPFTHSLTHLIKPRALARISRSTGLFGLYGFQQYHIVWFQLFNN